MLLNTGLMPAMALAEEKTPATEEVSPELADSLAKDALPEAAPESSTEPEQETQESKAVPTSEVPEESTEAPEAASEQKDASPIMPMDIGLIAWGKLV